MIEKSIILNNTIGYKTAIQNPITSEFSERCLFTESETHWTSQFLLDGLLFIKNTQTLN
jgi:hypothetical protein